MCTRTITPALFIALSELFSIALSTAVMLSMNPLFRYAWMKKHANRINKKLNKWGISMPELEEPLGEFMNRDRSANPIQSTSKEHH